MKIEILYEDDDVVVFNKPAGILSIPHRFDKTVPSIASYVEHRYEKLFTIHRIDKETSGVIIFGKNAEAHRYFSLLFQNREVGKVYHALAKGNPVHPEGEIKNHLMEHPTLKGKYVINKKGKYAHSEYKTLKSWSGYTYYEVEIFTGRTHQIRLHLQNLGTPIIADPVYGDERGLYLSDFKRKFNQPGNYEEERPLMGRLALHSYKLSLRHLNGEDLTLIAPIPKEFRASINQLDKNLK